MIEIKFIAKGKTLEELLQHLDMVATLMKLRLHDEVITNYKNKGHTKSSDYEWSIRNTRDPLWIEGVAIRLKADKSITWKMVKGSHAVLIQTLIRDEHIYSSDELEEGFILKNQTFLNRFEANKHVFNTGQIKEVTGSKLYSHELW